MASAVPIDTAELRGFLHEGHGPDGLVLSHGAGSNCEAPVLAAAARAFAEAGLTVLRCDLAFRRTRPSGPPPRGAAAADQAGLREAAAWLRGRIAGRIFLGGHSYGGRQASLLAAEDAGVAHALLLLSYPLHPPKQLEKLRTDHFPRLRPPCVFVHGPSDPFATPQELAAAASLIPAPTRIVTVAGAGHDLRQGRFDWSEAVAALIG
jgi:predicted alpha/beta-hydrolase family hydrolase